MLAHIDASRDFRTASQVHDELRQDGQRIGLSTVYRFLQALADRGELDVIHLADGEAAYRRCSMGHHHHLICRTCGHAVEVSGPAVETWANRVAEQHGFRDEQHDIEIFGLCSACA